MLNAAKGSVGSRTMNQGLKNGKLHPETEYFDSQFQVTDQNGVSTDTD